MYHVQYEVCRPVVQSVGPTVGRWYGQVMCVPGTCSPLSVPQHGKITHGMGKWEQRVSIHPLSAPGDAFKNLGKTVASTHVD